MMQACTTYPATSVAAQHLQLASPSRATEPWVDGDRLRHRVRLVRIKVPIRAHDDLLRRRQLHRRVEQRLDLGGVGDGVGIAVSKSDGTLKALINQALRRVRETGRYEELLLRYFPNRPY